MGGNQSSNQFKSNHKNVAAYYRVHDDAYAIIEARSWARFLVAHLTSLA